MRSLCKALLAPVQQVLHPSLYGETNYRVFHNHVSREPVETDEICRNVKYQELQKYKSTSGK